METEVLTVLVADPDDAFAARAARRVADLNLGALRLERAHSRDDLRRASLRTDLDIVLLDGAGEAQGEEPLGALRRALAARWRGPLVARLGDPDDEERLARLALCARERRTLGALLDHDGLRYRAAFEHAASAALLLSSRGRVLQANPASSRLFGQEVEDLLGRSIHALFHGDDTQGAERLFERALAGTDTPPEAELRLAARLGEDVVAHALLAPVFDEAGRALFFVLQLTDISARRRAENEARKKQRLFESILRIQAQYIRTAEPRAVYAEILKRLSQVTGSPHGFFAEVMSDDEPAIVRAISDSCRTGSRRPSEPFEGSPLRSQHTLFADALTSGEPVVHAGALLDPRLCGFPASHTSIESCAALPLMRGRRALGLVVLANAPGGYRRDAIDELKPLLATAAGVLENLWQNRRREAVEAELHESQRALATLMGHLPGMAYRSHDDPARTLEFSSAGCCELAGRTPEELLARHSGGMRALIHPDDLERVARTVHWALLERRRFELTWRLVHADGSERVIWEQGCGVFDERGELLFVEGLLTDVTEKLRAEEERRRLEARVQHAQKLESLGVLAGGIAHDFNNLLLGILGHAELAARRSDLEPVVRSSLAAIEAAALRAAELADHMLAYTGRGALYPRPVDLSALVARSRCVLERLLGAGSVLDLDLGGDLPLVSSDPGRVQELLVHTLRNCAEAMNGSGGRVVIRTWSLHAGQATLDAAWGDARETANGFVALEVHDDGSGMPRAVLARACDPFFTTKEPGRGLGLSTVLGGVRAHGGALSIESEPGAGTRVRMLFPVPDPEPASPRPALPVTKTAATKAAAPKNAAPKGKNSAPKSPAPEQTTVLVVDDEALVRDLARAVLEDAGYAVLVAQDGEHGAEVFAEHAGRIAAVLLDLTMPRLDGEGMLARIRALDPGVRVLLTSGYAEQDAMHRIASRAGVEFLQKPWRLEDLLGKLGGLIAAARPSP